MTFHHLHFPRGLPFLSLFLPPSLPAPFPPSLPFTICLFSPFPPSLPPSLRLCLDSGRAYAICVSLCPQRPATESLLAVSPSEMPLRTSTRRGLSSESVAVDAETGFGDRFCGVGVEGLRFRPRDSVSRLTVSVSRSAGRPAIRICLGDVRDGCRTPSGGRFYIVPLASGAAVAAAEGGDRPRCELGRAPETPRSSAGLSRSRQSSGASLVSQSSGVQAYVGRGCRCAFGPEPGVGAAGVGRPARRSSAPEA